MEGAVGDEDDGENPYEEANKKLANRPFTINTTGVKPQTQGQEDTSIAKRFGQRMIAKLHEEAGAYGVEWHYPQECSAAADRQFGLATSAGSVDLP